MTVNWDELVARLHAMGVTVLGWLQSIGSALLTLFMVLLVVGVVSVYALDFFLALCIIAFRNPVVIFSWRMIAWLIRTTRFWARGPGQAVRHRKGA